MKVKRVGVDLAKNVFHVHGVDRRERTVWTRRLSRDKWLAALIEKVEPGCEVGMEACAGAHHWARALQAHGYTVKLIAPQFVKPYVKSNKNDRNDAEAICEAMSRPTMRYVEVKSVEQQDIHAGGPQHSHEARKRRPAGEHFSGRVPREAQRRRGLPRQSGRG